MRTAMAITSSWLSLLPFHSVDFPVDLIPTEITYVEHDKGQEVRRKTLSEKEMHALKEFFVQNKKGWRSEVNSYAPKHAFTSATMKINCFAAGGVVVNYADKNNAWTQISIKESVGACPGSILDDATASPDVKPT